MSLEILTNFANWKRLTKLFCMSDLSSAAMLQIIWRRNENVKCLINYSIVSIRFSYYCNDWN